VRLALFAGAISESGDVAKEPWSTSNRYSK
jgi:hypothetical protein